MHIDTCGNTHRQKCHANGSRKELKYKSLFRDTTNVEREMYDYTGDNWSHQNNNKKV